MMAQDCIVVHNPDGTTQVIPLAGRGLPIGRQASCELQISHPKVSRRHARVQFDGQQVTITDLKSSNDSYLGQVRLPPGVPQVWAPHQLLRIADYQLELVRGPLDASLTPASGAWPSTPAAAPGSGRPAGIARALPMWALSALAVACMVLLAGLGLLGYGQMLTGNAGVTQTANAVFGEVAAAQTSLVVTHQAADRSAEAATVQAAINATLAAKLAADATTQAQAATNATIQAKSTADAATAQAADNATTLAQLAAGATAQAQAAAIAAAQAMATADAATAAALSDAPIIVISADQLLLAPGACTVLRWNIEHVQAVYLDGAGVVGQSERQVCPAATTRYTWRIVKTDGSQEERSLTIVVGPGPAVPAVAFDFIAQAPAAEWVSAHGTYYLTWNGAAEDSNGCAAWRDSPVLEDGSQPPRVLLTIPNWSAGGETLGDFQLPQPIQAGDHLRSRVGFLQGYAAGQVEFKVMVHGVGVHQTVADLTDSASNGVLLAIDVDLTPYAGLQEITLAVRAGAAVDQDAAVWVDTRIERP
jgi:hypothetical protein